jgi:hypothetical protein
MAIPISYNIRNLAIRKTTTIMTALGIALSLTAETQGVHGGEHLSPSLTGSAVARSEYFTQVCI